jgi:hypothetical protein
LADVALRWHGTGTRGRAFRILSVESEAAAESAELGTITWTVTVKLTDVDELRRLAAEARPDAEEIISRSLAAAWRYAVDPFAPMRSIPGITWRPLNVDVEHLHPAPGRVPPNGAGMNRRGVALPPGS